MKTNRLKWIIFGALALIIIMIDVDMTAVNLAVMTITQGFHVPLSAASWVINGYIATAAALMAFGGRCGDYYSVRRVLCSAIFVFIAASALIACAHSFLLLVFGRVLQGAAVAFMFPAATVVVRDIFPEHQQGLAVGSLIAIAGAAQGLGPLVGGMMMHIANWRWIFFMNIPLALISCGLIYFYLSEKESKNENESKNEIKNESKSQTGSNKVAIQKRAIGSAIALFVGLFSLMTILNEFLMMSHILIIGLIIIACFALTYFVISELHTEVPLLDLKLLANRAFAGSVVMRFIVNFVYFSWIFLLALFLQKVMHDTTLKSGAMMLGLTLMTAILSVPVGRTLDKMGTKMPLKIGFMFMLLANLALLMLSYHHQVGCLLIGLGLAGVAIAILIPSTAVACMQATSPQSAGGALGILYTLGFMGASLGVAVSSLFSLSMFHFGAGFVVIMAVAATLSLFGILLANYSSKTNVHG